MDYVEQALDVLAGEPVCGYYSGQAPASEPTALAALALEAKGRYAEARAACGWLMQIQTAQGSVGVRNDAPTPRWPTALAVLAWLTQRTKSADDPINRAVDWSLSLRGEALEPIGVLGHDVTLVGWPWVEGTHSWIEPTALQVIALRAAGKQDHPRTREAVRLLIDRQMRTGGCNYGNTSVLGQQLMPHVQPTGMALTALAGQSDHRGRIQRSLGYLGGALGIDTTTTSLCWGLIGMAAHGIVPEDVHRWLAAASRRLDKQRESPYQRALLVLASLSEQCPLITLPRKAERYAT